MTSGSEVCDATRKLRLSENDRKAQGRHRFGRLGGELFGSALLAMEAGQNPTLPPLAEVLENNPPIDRTTTNAWEDPDFLSAVRAMGRRKLVICALWTEICMAFPTAV